MCKPLYTLDHLGKAGCAACHIIVFLPCNRVFIK